MNLDALGIVSKNLEKTVQFYEILGLSFKEAGGPEHLEGATQSGLRVMIDSVDLMKKINPDWQEPTGSGIILCFKQKSSGAVDQVFSATTTAGFKGVKEPWDAFWGQRYASVRDPDGNQVDLFADL